MAKKQTRRTISLNRSVYEAVKLEAAARGISAAQFVEQALISQGVKAAPSMPMSDVAVTKMRIARGYRPVRVVEMRPSLERQYLGDGIANALGFR